LLSGDGVKGLDRLRAAVRIVVSRQISVKKLAII
jgi:hypothetical protein